MAQAVTATATAGLAQGPDEERAVALVHALAGATHDPDLLHGWLAAGSTDAGHGGVSLDPALRWTVVQRLARLDALDDDTLAAELAADPSASGELGAALARAARPRPEAKAAAWRTMTEDLRLPNRMFDALATGLWDPEQPDLCSGYVDRYLDEMPRLLHRRGPTFAQAVGWAFPAMALTDAQVAVLRRVLDDPDTELLGTLRRTWEDAYDDLASRWATGGPAGRMTP